MYKPTKYLHIQIEYRAVSGSGVFRIIDPPPPLPLASVSSLAPKAGGTHSPDGEGVGGGGSIFLKTPDIGLVSHSIIPLPIKRYFDR
jgi:hypothetical protein